MPGKRAALRHLQGLQSSQPLEPPPACLGTVNLAQLSAQELQGAAGAEGGAEGGAEAGAAGGAALSLAEFWISLLEGEHVGLQEELAKHRQRHQLALRQGEARASALREAEGERRRLQAELRALRERPAPDAGGAQGAAAELQGELVRERAAKEELESQLVRVKVRYAEALQRADSLQCLVEYYEDQLRVLNPSFEPANLASVSHLVRPSEGLDASELESNASGANDGHSVISGEKEKPKPSSRRRGIKAGISKMKQIFNRRDSREQAEQPTTPGDCPSLGSTTPRVATAEHSPGGGGSGPAVPASSPAASDAEAGEAAAAPASGRPKRWELRRE